MVWLVLNDPERGCNSYILGDETIGAGLVVDPLAALGADSYVLAAQEAGLGIQYVVETHVHADHLSAAQDLASMLGIPISFGHRAPASFPFHPLRDNDVLSLGNIEVTVWETPGHTPESISLVVRDLLRGPDPWFVLTGDSLFVGDVGRPDLGTSDALEIEAAAHDQRHSITRLLSLPDFVEVYPAHYGASPCGGLFMSRKPSSTIGYERRNNHLLQEPDEAAFVAAQLALLKPPPEDAMQLRQRNVSSTHLLT